MRWTPFECAATALFAAVVPVGVHAKVYATVQQAQAEMFGQATLTPHPVLLGAQQQQALRTATSLTSPFNGSRVWKVDGGGWFVVDQVIGKHEAITFAVGIDAGGSIRQVAVLEYLESYGYEIAEERWSRQFVGKSAASPIQLNDDIANISGATLSCRHVTDAVRRVMLIHDQVLAKA